MDTKHLQKQLQQKYDRDTWRRVLESVFASVYFLNTPAPISMPNSQIAEFHQTGVVRLHDGKNIALFEARLNDDVHLLRNRVGVRNLMTRFIDEAQTHGVLVVYDQGKANYRLTFVARESGITPQGEWVAFETASKRFTYVLGEGETCRTAAERLALLAAKKAAAGLSDVIDAFSVERLSKEFFTRYKTHYQAFVEYLTASNFRQSAFRGDEKAIRDFVKKLLGRIVFLHFLQKKGWLGATDNTYANGDRQFMQQFWDASGKSEIFYQTHLTRLFFDALNNNRREQDAFDMPDGAVVKIPYLNGGLFDKDQHEPDWLTFPPALFDNLFAFFGEYNFTIDENDPEEREVGIDPEMLGHIFENLLEDNKDKGAFYTPKEIVQYMTQESLIEYLYAGLTREKAQECQRLLWPPNVKASVGTPKDTAKASFGTPDFGISTAEGLRKPLEYFIRYKLKGDELPPEALQGDAARFFRAQIAFMQQHGAALDRLLDAVKICDPAIGSGAFPMGLLNEIYHCKILLNNTYTPADRAAIKRRIIEHSIYGVDIEKGAVDIARLRFWLALIVEEATPTPLPNLDYKIVVGDSLISKFEDHVIDIEWDDQPGETAQFGLLGSNADERKRDLLKRVTERQREFFHADAAAKPALAQDIRALKIDLLIARLDAMIAQHGEEHAPKGTGKTNQKQLERYLHTEGWKQARGALTVLKHHPERPFNHFDWKLDFPEILNPALVEQECQRLLWPVNASVDAPMNTAKASFGTPTYTREPGFDIVIGNPPYGASYNIEYKKYFQTSYQSAKSITGKQKGSLDTYSLFIDKGLNLANNTSVLAYIVPLAIASSEAMTALHNMMFQMCENIYISTYSNRPKKIFDSADQRVAILICHKNNKPTKNLFTTRVNKRYEGTSIEDVIKRLEYVNSFQFIKFGRIPKVGSSIELSILQKLYAIETTLADLYDENGQPVYYRSAGGRYYNIITNFPTGSSQEKIITIKTEYRNLVAAILSSNLYYWFLHIYSDNLHVKSYELDIFPIPVDAFSKETIACIEQIYDEYLHDLHKNSKVKQVSYAHVSEYREYYARYSKLIIDKLDIAIKDAYRLSDEEIKFIINYDIMFRTNDEIV